MFIVHPDNIRSGFYVLSAGSNQSFAYRQFSANPISFDCLCKRLCLIT